MTGGAAEDQEGWSKHMVEQNTRRMRCGCGFELSGEDATIEAFNEHVCMCIERDPLPRWHESLFSIWGVFIVLAIAVLAEEIVKALVGAR